MMDIAEIRKKARKQPSGGELVVGGIAPSEPITVSPAGTAANCVAGTVLPAVAGLVSAVSMSGLDRLFAGTSGVLLATEEVYQTTLASQDLQEEADFSQYLAFQLGPEEYALDITRISEIIKPREYTDIPRAPEFVLGLVSLRGVVVPVFDLRRRFGLGECRLGPASRIVVCRENEVTAGLLVDCINQVIRLADERIEPPPAVLSGVDSNMVEGVGRYQGRMVILLNLVNVLDVGMA